jgi:hypothetical protein
MKNVVFWDVTPCGSCKNQCFGERQLFNHQRDISVRRFLVIANFFPSSPILFTLIMEALGSSETLVLKVATRRNIP